MQRARAHRLRQAAAATATECFAFEFAEVAEELQGAPGGSLRVRRLSRSVEATFALCGTHPIPERLPAPPAAWAQPFAALAAAAVNLPTTDLWEGHALTAQFWDPFLANRAVHQIWLPGPRRWSAALDLPPEARPWKRTHDRSG